MIGQQGQDGGKPQEAGGNCSNCAAVWIKNIENLFDKIWSSCYYCCRFHMWLLNNIYSKIIMNLKLIY